MRHFHIALIFFSEFFQGISVVREKVKTVLMHFFVQGRGGGGGGGGWWGGVGWEHFEQCENGEFDFSFLS